MADGSLLVTVLPGLGGASVSERHMFWCNDLSRADQGVRVEALTFGMYSTIVFDDVPRLFNELSRQWRTETTTVSSSFADIVMNSAYQRVIGLGWAAVPHILADLQCRPGHWGWALSAITGVDPVPEEAEGDIEGIAEAWLRWGRARGLVA